MLNKEEIKKDYLKKAKKYIEHEINTKKLINGYTDIYIFQNEVELLLRYIQHLEQKESILDKVTNKLKKYLKQIKQDGIYGYDTEIREILNIIEGEKK